MLKILSTHDRKTQKTANTTLFFVGPTKDQGFFSQEKQRLFVYHKTKDYHKQEQKQEVNLDDIHIFSYLFNTRPVLRTEEPSKKGSPQKGIIPKTR